MLRRIRMATETETDKLLERMEKEGRQSRGRKG